MTHALAAAWIFAALLVVAGGPPVIARLSDDQVLLDVRCLSEEELGAVVAAVRSAQ